MYSLQNDKRGAYSVSDHIRMRDKEDYSYMLEQLQNFYERFNHEKPKVIPSLPFVADMIMPAALFCMKELEWTGDFCRCMGWAVLSPESIRP